MIDVYLVYNLRCANSSDALLCKRSKPLRIDTELGLFKCDREVD